MQEGSTRMGCMAWFGGKCQSRKPLKTNDYVHGSPSQISPPKELNELPSDNVKSHIPSGSSKDSSQDGANPIAPRTFTFAELVLLTNKFRPENLIGEGGFGRVYKGQLKNTGQLVAIKQLDVNGLQGNHEFLVEVLMLRLLYHPNLVTMIGYCADGDQRLLIYEYMPLGSLDKHLHDVPSHIEALDWTTRMKIALGAAQGLQYLHERANPPVIYRDFKASNILLNEGFSPKLSDFGLAKLGPSGDETHVVTRVMGTYGYCAPEYANTGRLTMKADVYSFGVVLLELITGRKAIDKSRPARERNLVSWACPLFFKKQFTELVDPRLKGVLSIELLQALYVAARCVNEIAATRPTIGEVVTTLEPFASRPHHSTKTNHSKSNASLQIHGKDVRRDGHPNPIAAHSAAKVGLDAMEREEGHHHPRGSPSERGKAKAEYQVKWKRDIPFWEKDGASTSCG